MDLPTVLVHELGHVAGLSDDDGTEGAGDLMHGYLKRGERRAPAVGRLLTGDR
jgi:hypothetical protein